MTLVPFVLRLSKHVLRICRQSHQAREKTGIAFPLRHLLCVALVLAPTVARSTTIVCAGDCNADGMVTVDELLTGVGIALGSEPIARCSSLDENGTGTVAINNVLTAVNNALDGCPADVSDAAVAGVLATTQALADFSLVFLLSLSSANNFSGGGAAAFDDLPTGGGADAVSQCPLAGTEQRTCEDLEDGVVAIPIRVDNCTYAIAGSIVSISGLINLQGAGLCPGVFIPANVRLDFAVSTTVKDANGMLLRSTDFDLAGFIQELTFGLSACSVKTIMLNVGGTARTETPNGGTTMLDLRDSHAMISFAVISGTCQPAVARMSFTGEAHVTNATIAPPYDLTSSFSNVSVTRNPILNAGADLAGSITAACLSGTASVMSRSTVLPGPAGTCPMSGALDISVRGTRAIARYAAGGTVEIDRGETARSTRPLPRA